MTTLIGQLRHSTCDIPPVFFLHSLEYLRDDFEYSDQHPWGRFDRTNLLNAAVRSIIAATQAISHSTIVTVIS